MIPLFPSAYASCLLEVCSESNIKEISSNTLSFEMIKMLKDKEDVIALYHYASLIIIEKDYLKSLKIFKNLFKQFRNKNNKIRMIQTELRICFINYEVNRSEVKNDIKTLKEYANEPDLNTALLRTIHHSIAMYYYQNKNFKDAIPWFEKAYQLEKTMSTLLYLCASCSQSNNPIPLDLEKEIEQENNHYPYLKYYEMKYKGENFKILEEYLMNELIKALKNKHTKEPFWSMFKYEIHELSKKNKSYKSIYKFTKIMEKVTKPRV